MKFIHPKDVPYHAHIMHTRHVKKRKSHNAFFKKLKLLGKWIEIWGTSESPA